MVRIASWNIQAGLGCDGRVDLGRIASVLGDHGPLDVVCLQEVARHMPTVDGGMGEDQVAALSRLFPDYHAYYGIAVDRPQGVSGRPAQFGNVIFSGLPVLERRSHLLPQPAEAGVKHMLRQASEVTVVARGGPLRITTTHLEFHSAIQQQVQSERLWALNGERAANVLQPPKDFDQLPYKPTPSSLKAVLCGDFNFLPESAGYKAIIRSSEVKEADYLDAWPLCNGNRPHDPTCGLYDQVIWPDGPNCRDFFFVTAALAPAVEAFEVDQVTAASDHQPLFLTLNDLGE